MISLSKLATTTHLFAVCLYASLAQGALTSGEFIPVGDGDDLGPFSPDAIEAMPLGAANVYGSAQPDLFIERTGAGSTGIALHRWLATDTETQAPIFGELVHITHPFAPSTPPYARVWESADGDIFGFFLSGSNLIITEFDADTLTFTETARHSFTGRVPRNPGSVAMFPNADGSFEVVLGIADGNSSSPSEYENWDPRYRYFGGSGYKRGVMNYRYLFGMRLSGLANGASWSNIRRISPTTSEVHTLFAGITPANLGPGHERDIITGARMGNILYYENTTEGTGSTFEDKRFISDSNGLTRIHPNIRPNPISYPDPVTGESNLIVGGEGGFIFYKFARSFNDAGAPIYHDPVPVLEANANLYSGSLSVTNIVDWDGDGANDLVVGTSEGFLKFFKNTRTTATPEFANGVNIEADGEPIQIQSGYWRSIQGAQEARWGYICPEVADWNGDGLLDVIMGSTWSEYLVFLNIGSATEPILDEPYKLMHEGVPLHGTWRSKPGVASFDGRTCIVILDDQNEFHRYWRLDDRNVEDGGKLPLDDGGYISAGPMERHSGALGRVKINQFDWDEDGKFDLLLGTFGRTSVPSPDAGLPAYLRTKASVLFLRNVGTNLEPSYAYPRYFAHDGDQIADGGHSIGPDAGKLGPLNQTSLVVSFESGRFVFFTPSRLTLEEWDPEAAKSGAGGVK